MTKELFIDIDNDCFYTDGNIFISTSSGETKGIDDFDLTCQNVLKNFFSTFNLVDKYYKKIYNKYTYNKRRKYYGI